jgi:hypothetical protein
MEKLIRLCAARLRRDRKVTRGGLLVAGRFCHKEAEKDTKRIPEGIKPKDQ